jgi:hypothetical protein
MCAAGSPEHRGGRWWRVPDTLTQVLVAPPAPVEQSAWNAALGAARAQLSTPAASRGWRVGTVPFRITEHDIRTVLGAEDASASPPRRDDAFSWSARTARRALGLAAVRALVAGDATTPVEAVRARVAESSRLVHGGSYRAAALDHWLAGLSPAGRAAVGAEAVTWCTRLWTGLEWGALGPRLVIGRDHWWDSPHSALLALRGRAEVRTERAHLVVLSGPRRRSVRAELALVLLVEALRAREGTRPGRVVGWWPDSGHLVRVEAEPAVLTLAAEAVIRVLACGGHEQPTMADGAGRPVATPAA